MKISEIFFSLQGEGVSAGEPRLFIRFSGCNLACFFCDTKYHVDSRELTDQDKMLLAKNSYWCITGGEPLLHQREIMDLIRIYSPLIVEIETNGSVPITEEALKSEFFLDEITLFNISPKEPRFQPKQICPEPILLKQMPSEFYYKVKFVYSDKKSENFIKKIVKKYKVPAKNVWIMAEGKTREEQEKKAQEVWNFCVKNKYNFSPRLHVNVWDSKKGV